MRTERVKFRYQDVRFTVAYQRGKIIQSDHLSRRAKPLQKLPQSEEKEANDLNNLLYMLHTNLVLNGIGYVRIAQCTKEDQNLLRIGELMNQGQTWIPKTEAVSRASCHSLRSREMV